MCVKCDDFQLSLDEVMSALSSVATNDEAVKHLCSVSILLQKLNDSDFKRLVADLDMGQNCARMLELVFSNAVFRSSLLDVFDKTELQRSTLLTHDEREAFDWSTFQLEKKQFIKLMLDLAGLLLSSFYPYLQPDDLYNVRRKVSTGLMGILEDSSVDCEKDILGFLLIHIACEIVSPEMKFPFRINTKFFFNHILIASVLINIILLAVVQHQVLRKSFRRADSSLPNIKLRGIISSIYGSAMRIEGGIDSKVRLLSGKGLGDEGALEYFIESVRTNNEKILGFIIQALTKDIYYPSDSGAGQFVTFNEQVLLKADDASRCKAEISTYCQKRLAAFDEKNGIDERGEWSNKVFLATLATLSVLEGVQSALNDGWKSAVVQRELANWINSVHLILNKEELEDDWVHIRHLAREENQFVEWKATLMTPIKDMPTSIVDAKAVKTKLRSVLTKNVLGMMNSDGGSILVGLVERSADLINPDFAPGAIEKGGVAFVDIEHELKLLNKDLDKVKREVQDVLARETQLPIDVFDKLWSIERYILKEGGDVVTVLVVSVSASPKKLFSVENFNNGKKLALLMRVNGRTIYVDPRTYIEYKKIPIKADSKLSVQLQQDKLKLKKLAKS